MNEEPELTAEELEALRADLLPDREAMSLLATNPAAYASSFDDLTSATPPAGTSTTDAPHVIDAGTASSGTESVTSEDRSEIITQSDTASSET